MLPSVILQVVDFDVVSKTWLSLIHFLPFVDKVTQLISAGKNLISYMRRIVFAYIFIQGLIDDHYVY